MPLYETASESGRIQVRLKALTCAQQDVADYGPITRDRDELALRAEYHVARLEREKPTPQVVLTDDVQYFTSLFATSYAVTYLGLVAAHTGLKDPYRLDGVVPRFTTSVNLDGSEDEHLFFGLRELQVIVADEQARRKVAQEEMEGVDLLFSVVQVSIYDQTENELEWYNKTTRFVAYDILGVRERSDGIDEILQGLGLPFEETNVSVL